MAGNNASIGGGGFHHVAIRAHDFDASVKFYSEALGFTEKMVHRPWSIVEIIGGLAAGVRVTFILILVRR